MIVVNKTPYFSPSNYIRDDRFKPRQFEMWDKLRRVKIKEEIMTTSSISTDTVCVLSGIGLMYSYLRDKTNKISRRERKDLTLLTDRLNKKCSQKYDQAHINTSTDLLIEALKKSSSTDIKVDFYALGVSLILAGSSSCNLGADRFLLTDLEKHLEDWSAFSKKNKKVVRNIKFVTFNIRRVLNDKEPFSIEKFTQMLEKQERDEELAKKQKEETLATLRLLAQKAKENALDVNIIRATINQKRRIDEN